MQLEKITQMELKCTKLKFQYVFKMEIECSKLDF